MYCKDCGKQIFTDSDRCAECEAKRASFYRTETVFRPLAPNGFSRALTSVILAVSGIFLFIIAFIVMTAVNVSLKMIGIFLMLGVLACEVVAIILGAFSIAHFVNVKRKYGEKQIATLIIGIGGCIIAAAIAFYIMIFLLFFGLLIFNI